MFFFVFLATASATGVMLLYVRCCVCSCLLFQPVHKHTCTDFSITFQPFAAVLSLSVYFLLCSLSFLWVFLPGDYHTFMQPDTGSCFILGTDPTPPTPSSSPKPPFSSSSVCTLASGSLGLSTNMLNRV